MKPNFPASQTKLDAPAKGPGSTIKMSAHSIMSCYRCQSSVPPFIRGQCEDCHYKQIAASDTIEPEELASAIATITAQNDALNALMNGAIIPTYADILDSKKLSVSERMNDLVKLKTYEAEKNERKFCGNAYLYHYQFDNLCRTSRSKPNTSLYDVMTNGAFGGPAKLYKETLKRERSGTTADRMFNCFQVNRGAVVFFKPSTAKWIYKKFGVTHVLDPTAGWGGRMLGAWALGIGYTGFDTNESLMPAYEGMINELPGEDNIQMNFENCLTADFTTIPYDFVLTSPPYINLELYEGMTPFESDEKFYRQFLMPLITKCITHCKPGGWVCFNISPKMYADLMVRGFRKPDEEHDLLQQKRMGVDKQDKIYCWKV